ncbi:MAG TPA: hypothetical protein VM755_05770 [Stellaceae bacterium]|nr:hypothetical protein [Stellaceae bacterium]
MFERVEIRVLDGDLAGNMMEMRDWLDRRRLGPNAFRCLSGGDSIIIRVDFEDRQDAADFARQFGGRLLAARVS